MSGWRERLCFGLAFTEEMFLETGSGENEKWVSGKIHLDFASLQLEFCGEGFSGFAGEAFQGPGAPVGEQIFDDGLGNIFFRDGFPNFKGAPLFPVAAAVGFLADDDITAAEGAGAEGFLICAGSLRFDGFGG